MDSDSSNVMSWVTNDKDRPWRFQFLFDEIKVLASSLQVHFTHILRLANSMADGGCFGEGRSH